MNMFKEGKVLVEVASLLSPEQPITAMLAAVTSAKLIHLFIFCTFSYC